MNELMKLEVQTTEVMSSREIAELTGKNHADVMMDIRRLIIQLTDDENESKFALVKYKDSKGELRPEYLLNKEQTIQFWLFVRNELFKL